MAIKLIKSEWCPYNDAYRKTYVLDSADDAASLPECCTGSMAMVAAKDGAMFMVNASGEWEEL